MSAWQKIILSSILFMLAACLIISCAVICGLYKNNKKLAVENANFAKEKLSLEDMLADAQSKLLERHPLEEQYQAEMSEWTGITAEGVEINIRYGDLWKAEMEKYISLLSKELAPEKKKWLSHSQAEWESFIKANEELSWQVNDQLNHDGSIMHFISASIYYERYRDRALFLKNLYNILMYRDD